MDRRFSAPEFSVRQTIPVAYTAFQLFDRSGAVTGVAALSRDRRQRERIEVGLQLLSRIGAAALNLLDAATTLRNIAAAFVPDFAACCAIDIVAPDGRRPRTVVHLDPTAEQLLRNLSPPSAQHPIALALENGRSSLVMIGDE